MSQNSTDCETFSGLGTMMSTRRLIERVLVRLWSLLRGDPSTVVRFGGPLILGGFLLAFVSARFDVGGVITGVFAMSLGACGGALREWRTERGLWMLSGLFLVLNIATYCLFVIGQVLDRIRGAVPPDLSQFVDFSIGTVFLSATIGCLAQITQQNWQLSMQSDEA